MTAIEFNKRIARMHPICKLLTIFLIKSGKESKNLDLHERAGMTILLKKQK